MNLVKCQGRATAGEQAQGPLCIASSFYPVAGYIRGRGEYGN
jgi:hypothetical protein